MGAHPHNKCASVFLLTGISAAQLGINAQSKIRLRPRTQADFCVQTARTRSAHRPGGFFHAWSCAIPSTFMTRTEAAEYLRARWGARCSVAWLARLAHEGGGPVFRYSGRAAVYAAEDLDRWAQGRLSAPVSRSSELAAAE
jgi:hypothetical protein